MAETGLCAADLIYPLFVIEGEDIAEEIDSMPGILRYSVDRLTDIIITYHAPEVAELLRNGYK